MLPSKTVKINSSVSTKITNQANIATDPCIVDDLI